MNKLDELPWEKPLPDDHWIELAVMALFEQNFTGKVTFTDYQKTEKEMIYLDDECRVLIQAPVEQQSGRYIIEVHEVEKEPLVASNLSVYKMDEAGEPNKVFRRRYECSPGNHTKADAVRQFRILRDSKDLAKELMPLFITPYEGLDAVLNKTPVKEGDPMLFFNYMDYTGSYALVVHTPSPRDFRLGKKHWAMESAGVLKGFRINDMAHGIVSLPQEYKAEVFQRIGLVSALEDISPYVVAFGRHEIGFLMENCGYNDLMKIFHLPNYKEGVNQALNMLRQENHKKT